MARCKRCGKTGLHWREHDEGWRLHVPSGGRHACHDPGARARRQASAESRDAVEKRYGEHGFEARLFLT